MKTALVASVAIGMAFTFASATRVAAAEPTLVDKAAIDTALGKLVEDKQILGVSALVFERDKEAYFGAFGVADREKNKPFTRDTIVQIFSMTKPVVGVALMTLYDQGKFSLNDPYEKYFPEYANVKVYAGTNEAGQPVYEAPKRKITVYDVLRHTAGLTIGRDDKTAVGAIYREVDPRDFNNPITTVAKKVAEVPLAYQPGTRWAYSDAVDLQAALAEKLSGVPFDKYLEQKIFKPLGMKSTRYTILPTDKDRGQLAAMYTRNDDGTFTRVADEAAYNFNGQVWPQKPGSFGLVSTLDDYMKFARMLLGGGALGKTRVLESKTVRLMATNAMPAGITDTLWLPSKGTVGFGIDFAVRTAPPKDAKEASGAVGEFFWDGAANTLFWVDPNHDIAAVLFTQYRPFGRVPLHKNFRDAIYRNDPLASAD
jgi:CubicO group peptidase (beta-lactamase class C family)